MLFVDHAVERLALRTKMAVEDLQMILAADAYVYLGSRGRRSFLLFYSPRDRKCKVAVIDQGWKVVTILPRGARLPEGVDSITQARQQKAKTAFNGFVFEKFCGLTDERKQCLNVLVEIQIDKKPEVGVELPAIYPECAESFETLLPIILPDLYTVVRAVEESRTVGKKKISYRIHFTYPGRVPQAFTPAHEFILTHKKLLYKTRPQ